MTTTYSTPEEAIDGLIKPELISAGLDPAAYDLDGLAELVLYDYSEGGFAGPAEGFGMHPELSSSTFWDFTEAFVK